MPRLDWLSQHMQHCDTLALWLHRQFSHEFAEQTLADWQAEFAAGQQTGDWQCLIALQQEQLLGGAVLARNDLPRRPDLGPWLACVLVAPEARRQGLAERLVEGICSEARAQGVQRLYLHTQDQRSFYAKRGWRELESFQAWGDSHWLMLREL